MPTSPEDTKSGRSPAATVSRKASHVELCIEEDVRFLEKTAQFESLEFEHNALPELDLEEVVTRSVQFGRSFELPLLISSMTGGYAGALAINRSLAIAANGAGLGIGVGSARQALESVEHHATYRVIREEAPNAFVMTNLGAVEIARIGKSKDVASLTKLVELVQADALAVHLNPVQELLQPEGNRDFRGVLDGIQFAVRSLHIPVIVKEVGAGISASVAQRLIDVGVQGIDVAGAGGTSWAGVEILRNDPASRSRVLPFREWGIPTAQAVASVAALRLEHSFVLVASGGIQSGIDIAKAIALGADLVGSARPFLQALARGGDDALHALIADLRFQLRGAMFLTGSRTLEELRSARLIRSNNG